MLVASLSLSFPTERYPQVFMLAYLVRIVKDLLACDQGMLFCHAAQSSFYSYHAAAYAPSLPLPCFNLPHLRATVHLLLDSAGRHLPSPSVIHCWVPHVQAGLTERRIAAKCLPVMQAQRLLAP